jgi:diazepam-binding inhibitor (GABA receptor modulating acyl-CoA-binding protein)
VLLLLIGICCVLVLASADSGSPLGDDHLNEEFEKATQDVKKLPQRVLTDEVLFKLYGLYQQATIGDNNTPEPDYYQKTARAKWTAWKKLYGMSKDDAKREYIVLVKDLEKEASI